MVLLLVFMQLMRDLFEIAKFLLISVPVFVSCDYEPQSCTGLIFQFANAFAIAITFARWRRHSEESTAAGLIFSNAVYLIATTGLTNNNSCL